jgi:hypothetical protein
VPVVHVRGLVADAERSAEALLLIARRVADAVPCDLDRTWCTFQELGAETIGGRMVDAEGRILYVDLWLRERDDAEASSRGLAAACPAAAEGFAVPVEDVWGTVRLVESGRVFGGGQLFS